MTCPPKLRLLWVGFSVLLLIWISVDVLHRARLDPREPTRHQTDLAVYTEAGAAFFDGRQPYEVSNVRGWRFLYPPLFAIVLAPLHTLDSRLQAAIWCLGSCDFGYGLFVEVRHVLRHVVGQVPLATRRESPPLWIVGPAGLTTLLASIAVLQRGQADLIRSYALGRFEEPLPFVREAVCREAQNATTHRDLNPVDRDILRQGHVREGQMNGWYSAVSRRAVFPLSVYTKSGFAFLWTKEAQ